MRFEELLFESAAFFGIAALYSAVGQAGASGYLAVMALGTMAPEVMRPTALTLNVLVASVTVVQFHRRRHLSWAGLWPLLAGSLPCAAVGGALSLPRSSYYVAVGLLLIASALLLLWRSFSVFAASEERAAGVKWMPALLIGAAVGLVSGLTGIGGGIFLSPALLALNWAGPRSAAGISAPFNLANSLIALGAGTFSAYSLPEELPVFAVCSVAGAFVGAWAGLDKLNQKALLVLLSLIVGFAGIRLLIDS
jgi:hypothetical protein